MDGFLPRGMPRPIPRFSPDAIALAGYMYSVQCIQGISADRDKAGCMDKNALCVRMRIVHPISSCTGSGDATQHTTSVS